MGVTAGSAFTTPSAMNTSINELISAIKELPRKPNRARDVLRDWEGVQRLGGGEHGWWVSNELKERFRLPE